MNAQMGPNTIYPVYVVQYNHFGLDHLPLDWEIVVQTGMKAPKVPVGHACHLVGSDATYRFEHSQNVLYESTQYWRGSLQIGTVRDGDLPHFFTLLSEVEVRKRMSNWNCQNWVHDGMRELYAQGFHVDHALAQRWTPMKDRMTRLLVDWEAADD